MNSHNSKYTVMLVSILSLASCGGGGGDSTGPSSDFFAPEIVEGFTVQDQSKTAIVLTWDRGSSSADSYNMYRDGALIANLNSRDNRFLDTGLLVDTMYSYQISSQGEAFGKIEESALSAVVLASTLPIATTVPAAPINMNAFDRMADSIGIDWADDSDNEEGFNVYRDGALVETFSFEDEFQSHTSSDLTFDTDYDFTVKAFNDAGESLALDATFSTRHEAVVPAAPTGVSFISATTSTIKIGFTDNADNEDGYMIFIGTSSDPREICTGQNLSECTIDGLATGTTYDMTIAAYVITSESSLLLFFIPSNTVAISASTL